jgi:hypothetical protein
VGQLEHSSFFVPALFETLNFDNYRISWLTSFRDGNKNTAVGKRIGFLDSELLDLGVIDPDTGVGESVKDKLAPIVSVVAPFIWRMEGKAYFDHDRLA